MAKRPKPKTDPIPPSSSTLTAKETMRKKSSSKWLKFSGAALLLTAFGMQMRQNQNSAKETERMQAAAMDGRSHIKALEYENLYYAVKATGKDEPEYLRLAAYNYYAGRVTMMLTSPGDKAKIAGDLRVFKAKADAVHDVESFQQFMGDDNILTEAMGKIILAGFVDADRDASRFGMLYMVLYGTGSLFALVGQALD